MVSTIVLRYSLIAVHSGVKNYAKKQISRVLKKSQIRPQLKMIQNICVFSKSLNMYLQTSDHSFLKIPIIIQSIRIQNSY